jgi:hypothetical protein
MHRTPLNQEVLNVFNFITVLIVVTIVFFLVVHPFNIGSSSPIGIGQAFGYLFCP